MGAGHVCPPACVRDIHGRFESSDVVVASWPECTLDTPAIERFMAIATGPEAPRDQSGRPWFEGVISGEQVLARLTDPPLSLHPAAAVERLRGTLVGPDGRMTCLVIPFTREGLTNRRRAVPWLRETLVTVAGISPTELHMGGPVMDNVSVDEASAATLGTYGSSAAVVILALTWWSLRSFRYALVVFLISLFSVGLCFLSLSAWGDRMNPVLRSVATSRPKGNRQISRVPHGTETLAVPLAVLAFPRVARIHDLD